MEVIKKIEPYISDTVVYVGGIPENEIQKNPQKYANFKDAQGKIYATAKGFEDISSIKKDDHYEIYLMPQDQDFAKILISLLRPKSFIEKYKPYIAFIAFRPIPDVQKSVWSKQYLPRIIIGMKPFVTKDIVKSCIDTLNSVFKSAKKFWCSPGATLAYHGIGYHPRYSEEIPDTKNLIYTAYGSGDYKDIKAHQDQFMRKGFWVWRSNDDMAYKSEDQRISTVPAPGSKE